MDSKDACVRTIAVQDLHVHYSNCAGDKKVGTCRNLAKSMLKN